MNEKGERLIAAIGLISEAHTTASFSEVLRENGMLPPFTRTELVNELLSKKEYVDYLMEEVKSQMEDIKLLADKIDEATKTPD